MKRTHIAAPVSVHAKSSDSESFASHALWVVNHNENCAWIVDSRATCHICHVEKCFTALYHIKEPTDVV